jgi:hypothetical protein
MVLTDANALFAYHQLQGGLGFTDVDADINQQHFNIPDPQLANPRYSHDVGDHRPSAQFIFSESICGLAINEIDEPMAFFGALDAANKHCNNLDTPVNNTGQVDIADTATAISLETGDSPPSFCKSRISGQSSDVSVSSAYSPDQKRGRQLSSKFRQQHIQNKPPPVPFQPRQQEQEQARLPLPPLPPAKTAKPSRSNKQPKRIKTSRAFQPIVIKSEAEEPDDPKHSKFLERNRVAASKSRQTKKHLMQELEDTKADLEKRRRTLQGNYNSLLEEVFELKNQLMLHSGCHDVNIDKWIEKEASRFVYGAPPLQTNVVN